ncbi:hypothetical protein ACJDU8_11950 [Clostridium sp. WILCCON 0269]|uniref:MaoC-like domain-containing protein n=1 Tax=Candidatus Clostridium eludens TaxID=3381663 RepID=A0ABW8SM54_9CLOT
MINLFKEFCSIEDFFYDGAFIAKVKYQCFQPKINEKTYRTEVVKNNRRLCILNCSGYIENKTAEILTVYLMLNAKIKEPIETENIKDVGSLWYDFSKKEIIDFSHLTGDTNSIHLTENPVVQGLFILKKLCDTTQANKIEIKYTYPIYGGNPVYIKHEKNIIKGFSKNILCFKATL